MYKWSLFIAFCRLSSVGKSKVNITSFPTEKHGKNNSSKNGMRCSTCLSCFWMRGQTDRVRAWGGDARNQE